jgi:predicted ATPase
VIRNWNIKNFKSVGEAHLSLAPLTLFAGANSSGKSTLLQSILLIAQTLAARGTAQTVVLNGHIVKLGQFDDLRNDASRDNTIELSWTIAPELLEDSSMMRLRRMQNRIESVACRVAFGLSDEKEQVEQLNPILHRFSLSCTLRQPAQEGEGSEESEGIEPVRKPSFIHLTRRGSPRPEEELTAQQRARTRVNFDLAIDLDEESKEDLRDEYPEAIPIGCILQAFLPGSLVVKFDERREIVRAIVGMLTGSGRARYTRRLANSKATIPASFLAELKQRISTVAQLFPDETESDGRVMPVQEFVERLRPPRVRPVLTSETINEIEAYALSALPSNREITSVSLPGDSLDDAVDITRDFFARQIKYLGPLREEPKALYPLQNTADPQEVGLHGEHTAAVLHRFRFSDVQYVPTAYFDQSDAQPAVQSASLEDAVFDWLRYLDVASNVDTVDEGKFGYGLKVKINGGKTAHDLTHVGVGVSQVLPIVVMCLLASRDTTIVLEQPELHLNPKVQTRLADFFLSMALMQKQCIIETHSEYLINRLRLRAAVAPGHSVSELMKLYFVEKLGDFTTYRDVVINEFGAIMRWPQGFFDQSQKEIEDILLAADRKAR